MVWGLLLVGYVEQEVLAKQGIISADIGFAFFDHAKGRCY